MEHNDGGAARRRLVYAAVDGRLRDRVAAELEDGDAFVVEPVADVDGVLDALEDDEPVDCVVSALRLAEGDWRDLATAVRDRHPDLPIVLRPRESDPDVASSVGAVGVTDYAPAATVGGPELRRRLRSAIDEYDRHRRRRTKSERYDALMESLELSIYFKDRDARFVDISRPIVEDLGEDIVGRTDAEIWGTGSGATGVESYHDDLEVVETGEPIVRKEELHESDDGDQWFQTSKYPWRGDDGDIRGLIGLTRDVTDQKERTRELRRQSQRLGQFASFVSHDFRNPINIAQGYLDRAIETGDEEPLAEVDDALSRMDHLVDDLLATVRRGEESAERITFRPFVDRVWTATETEHATIELDVPEKTTIVAVPGQLRQVLDNLFRNADQHAGSGVTVTVGTTDIGFYVEDDGPGVEPDRRDAVFEYGVSDGGTGIGLALVSEVAELHDWELVLTESEAGGARVEFGNCPVRRGEDRELEPGDRIPVDETTDVGDPTPPSSVEADGTDRTWTVRAGGRDVWFDVEEHGFAYATVDDSTRIVAHVADLEAVHEYSKAGLMVRSSPDSGSPFAYVGATPEHGTEVIHRTYPDDEIETEQIVGLGSAPRWYRIDWVDNTATLQASVDGAEWTTADRRSIEGQNAICVGLAVCSHDPERACRAVFEDVRVVQLRPRADED